LSGRDFASVDRIAILGWAGVALLLGFAPSFIWSANDLSPPVKMIAESRDLLPNGSVAHAHAGWEVSGPFVRQNGEASADNVLVEPFVMQPTGQVPLAGFDAIWLDYSTQQGVPPCRVDFELRLTLRSLSQPRETPSPVAAVTVDTPWIMLASTRTDPHGWRPKDFWYLATRWFGIASDDVWRFAYGQSNDLVVQRRWHQELGGVEAIDLAIADASMPSQVNLIIGTPGGVGDEVLPFAGIPTDSRLEDGRPGVRLYVGAALHRHHPSVLKEIIVFFPADARRLVIRNPVTEVSFFRRGARVDTEFAPLEVVLLPKHIQTIAPGRERAVIPLDAITNGIQAMLVQALLAIRPPLPEGRCAIYLERTRLVNTYSQR
jgi:hypothetical protein